MFYGMQPKMKMTFQTTKTLRIPGIGIHLLLDSFGNALRSTFLAGSSFQTTELYAILFTGIAKCDQEYKNEFASPSIVSDRLYPPISKATSATILYSS